MVKLTSPSESRFDSALRRWIPYRKPPNRANCPNPSSRGASVLPPATGPQQNWPAKPLLALSRAFLFPATPAARATKVVDLKFAACFNDPYGGKSTAFCNLDSELFLGGKVGSLLGQHWRRNPDSDSTREPRTPSTADKLSKPRRRPPTRSATRD